MQCLNQNPEIHTELLLTKNNLTAPKDDDEPNEELLINNELRRKANYSYH
jgi:hypothetical protein